MKWFKHLTKPSKFIKSLEAKFGPAGFYVYFKICELMGLHYEVETPGEMLLPKSYFYREFYGIHHLKVRVILDYCLTRFRLDNGLSGIYFEDRGDQIFLKINKFEELADEYTTKMIKDREKKVGSKSRPSPVQEEEEEVEEDNKPPLPPLPDPGETSPGNGFDPDHVLSVTDLELFNAFWEQYPKQVGRIPAKRAFKTILNRDKHLPDMLKDLDRRKKEDPQWQREQGRFIPKPTTYLEDYLWTDKAIRDTRFDNLGEKKE